jgi:hypothetical protein
VTDSFFYPYVTRQVGGWTQELAWSVATSYAMAVIGVLIGAVTIIRIWKGKHDGLTGQLVLASLILFAIGVTMGNISWDEAQPHQVTEEFSMTKAVSSHYGVEARDAVCPGGTWTRHTDDCVTYTDKDGSQVLARVSSMNVDGGQQVTVEKLGGAQPAPTSSTKEETK